MIARLSRALVVGLFTVTLAGCGGGGPPDVAVLVEHGPNRKQAGNAVDVYGILWIQVFAPLGCSSVLVAPNPETLGLYKDYGERPENHYIFSGRGGQPKTDIEDPRSLVTVSDLQVSSVQGPEYSASGGFNDLANTLLGTNQFPPEQTYSSGGETITALVELSSPKSESPLFRKKVDGSPQFPETIVTTGGGGPAYYIPAEYLLADAVRKGLANALRNAKLCTHQPDGSPPP